jgi:broad specificity phosphatase PhoE
MGRFDRVVASPKPRAVETAVAMGFTVDREVEDLGRVPDEVEARVEERRPRSFADYAELVRRSDVVAKFARTQAALWEAELARVPDGGRLLPISHGNVIEIGTVSAVPEWVNPWGPSLGYLEGVRLVREGNRWTHGDVVRVEP